MFPSLRRYSSSTPLVSPTKLEDFDSHRSAEPIYLRGPLLDELLSGLGHLPSMSLLIGKCSDGLPLLLDMTNSNTGHFLIASDQGFANTLILHSILTSAFTLNNEEDVHIHMISPHLDQFPALFHQPHFKIVFDPINPETGILVEELFNLAQTRKGGSQDIHILAIDGLDILHQSLTQELRLLLNWLIEYGIEHGILIFASLEVEYLNRQMNFMIDGFRSRILGQIENPRIGNYLSGMYGDDLVDLVPGLEAYLRSGSEMIRIWVPQFEDKLYEIVAEDEYQGEER